MNINAETNLFQSNSESQKQWVDKKRYLWILSPALPMIGVGAMMIYRIAPKKMRGLAWIGPIAVHVIIPLLDRIIGDDKSNPPEQVIAQLEKDPYYTILVRSFIPMQYLAMFVGAYLYTRKNTPFADKMGIAISVGMLNGIAITNAHETGHKSDKFNQMLSHLVLAPTAYGHFRVEHNYGHHKNVATPEDPASAQMGESFWRFLPRSVLGSLKSAIIIEKKRLARQDKGFWSIKNELLQGWAITTGLYGVMIAVFGRKVVPFLAIQAVYGFALLEVVNYIEHYGLLRQKENGKYERTAPEHSWNSNKVMSNVFLYQLQRHSDHHAHPTRSFHTLRHFDGTPQLPSGYAEMIMAAYIPPLWFKIMDKKLLDHYEGDWDKINILPNQHHVLLKKYKEIISK
ncbi:alkane 1-monooxygenase [Acinetobacter seifertii]|uniref:alkane 1-monooxygenase n=1 Tax=Acinetobacter seifertii TaxID=1530123 RepID=UPI001902FD04|nr:alkane 1-monooxygenase [Acinetobacter seifertii]MBJ9424590.1 alkane 1-monooxygenase [Acinetobacter seifertii]